MTPENFKILIENIVSTKNQYLADVVGRRNEWKFLQFNFLIELAKKLKSETANQQLSERKEVKNGLSLNEVFFIAHELNSTDFYKSVINRVDCTIEIAVQHLLKVDRPQYFKLLEEKIKNYV